MHLRRHRRAGGRSTIELFLLEPALVSEAYVGWLNDPQVNRFLESRFVVARPGLDAALRAQPRWPTRSVLFLGMRSIELGRHVGNVKLGPIDRHHGLAEIGIMIGDRAAWGRGIASQRSHASATSPAPSCACASSRPAATLEPCRQRARLSEGRLRRRGRRRAHYLLDGLAEDAVILGLVL